MASLLVFIADAEQQIFSRSPTGHRRPFFFYGLVLFQRHNLALSTWTMLYVFSPFFVQTSRGTKRWLFVL